MRRLFLFFSAILSTFYSLAQNENGFISSVEFRKDTSLYRYPQDTLTYKGQKTIFFSATNVRELMEVTVYPGEKSQIQKISLATSEDYTVIDSFVNISNKFFRGKIRLNRLTTNPFTRLQFNLSLSNQSWVEEITLTPSFEPEISVPFEPVELYMGEERAIEFPAKNGFNILSMETYQTVSGLRFRIVSSSDKIRLLIQPEQPGEKELTIKLKTYLPYLSGQNNLTNDVPPFQLKFVTRPGRLHFINFDKTDFFWDPGMSNVEEVQVEYHRGLELNKTYRIENQQKPGGRLIAEIYTASIVDSKMLVWLRPYSLHRAMEGYLFIKDGDEAKFITNINILQRPAIQQISLLREGQDWTTASTVHPGEKVEVKIEGKGLSKADFQFEGINEAQLDTSRASDNVRFYHLKIPLDISKKRISVYMNKTITSYELQVREYQVPRELDFVSINYESEKISLSSEVFNKPILYRSTIRDVNILFDKNKIDEAKRLYGKQYLSVEVKIYNSRNDMIEYQKIENIVICPGENSPRNIFYDLNDCRNAPLNINDYLLHKTYELEGWSRLEILISHNNQKYSLPGYSRKITFIKERRTVMDLQISFPTGLLVKRFDQSGIGSFTGISTAFLAQLSFYDKHKAGKLKPYKIGAGFIALDVFNVNDKQRDMGIIVLGSLMPFKKEARFTFPLYIGAGYLLKSNTMFTVFGPGVQFNF